MLHAIGESFAVLRALSVPVTPPTLRPLGHLPQRLALPVLARAFATRRADIILARHANAARDEMATLAAELDTLARASGLATPHLDELARYVDPSLPPLPTRPERSATAAECVLVTFALAVSCLPALWRRGRGTARGDGAGRARRMERSSGRPLRRAGICDAVTSGRSATSRRSPRLGRGADRTGRGRSAPWRAAGCRSSFRRVSGRRFAPPLRVSGEGAPRCRR
jgi:hypothetical protein